MTTITQASPGQIRQINRFASDAVEKVLTELALDSTGAQRVIEHGDEFTETVRAAALASLKDLSLSDKWKDEETESDYGYLSGYKPKSPADQIAVLRQVFGASFEGGANLALADQALPGQAEGRFAIPRWETIAPTYNEAVQRVLDLIKLTRQGAFQNYRVGQIGPDRLRQSIRSAKFWETIANQQAGKDILVLPAQFGLVHRGRSVRRAREVMRVNEFGLGAFAVGVMLLTHPERLLNYDDLWVDCAGDEYHDPDSGVPFDRAPCFGFGDGGVEFGAGFVSFVVGRYGSASAFSPQE